MSETESFAVDGDIPERILSRIREKEMLFLGEYVHRDPDIAAWKDGFYISLAESSDFRLLARESVYCLFPFVEADSFPAGESPWISRAVTAYNRTAGEKKIIFTAVDMAHSVKHSPALVRDYLLHTAASGGRIPDELRTLADSFMQRTEPEEKDAFIRELAGWLGDSRSSLDEKAGEELDFYVSLLEASLRIKPPSNEEEMTARAKERNLWFIRTIERALERNRHRGLKMICDVGAPHAYKRYISKETDYYVGPVPEARHFDEQVYPGRVYSLLVRPFGLDYYGRRTDSPPDPLEAEALRLMGEGESIFIDLQAVHKNRGGGDLPYMNGEGTQFDGIVYLRTKL